MSTTTNVRGWQTVRRLGRGQSGEVYEARRADTIAALKVYRPSEAFGADQFRREIANARIAHDIIPDGSPAVLDDDETAERPWFAMTLAQPLRDTYPRTTAIAFLLRLIDLCIRLRDAGYYHGDLKKDNPCLIDGKLSLLDFASLVRVIFANTHGLRLGSDFHRAPETDADLVVDERTEVFALAVTFLQFAGLSTILRHAVPLLRALLPFPWMRYRTFEDFRKGVVREPLRFRRLVWISAGVWKTKIVTRWTAIVTGAVVLTLLTVGMFIAYADFLHSRSDYRKRHQRKIDTKSLVGEGYVAYRTGDMLRASNLLEAAINSCNFNAKDHPNLDVEGLYRDACDRLRRAGEGGRQP